MALPPPTRNGAVVITGASSGIGTELARELARRSYGVVLVARRADRLLDLAADLVARHGVEAGVEPCDLADSDARDKLVARLIEREILGVCNNAGFGTLVNLAKADLAREQQIVRLNVEAVHHLTGAFLPGMVERGAGAILNVASTAAYQPLPGFATYAASKAFVQSFSEAVHSELEGTGVSVTTLSPGFTRTDFVATANAEEQGSALPGMLYMKAADVARAGVDAMLAGRRTATPGLHNRASSYGGRFIPRSLLLPLLKRATRAPR